LETRTRGSFGETRTGRFLTGVAIVWSIAGAFVALEIGLPELLSRAVRAGVVPDRLVIPSDVTPDSSSHCRPSSATVSPPPKAPDEARYLAWRLGFQVGWSAGLANAKLGDEGSARSLAEWQARAGEFGIPAPSVPSIRHAARALGEFELHIESDPQCTAARLSQAYGQPRGSAFKLGAYVGFAAVFRMTLPEAAVFVANIRHHGQSAGVPAELLRPLLQTSLDDVAGGNTHEKIAAILDPLDAYFKNR
jgi:hypothetical protein